MFCLNDQQHYFSVKKTHYVVLQYWKRGNEGEYVQILWNKPLPCSVDDLTIQEDLRIL